MNDIQNKTQAINIINRLIPIVEQAESKLKSARTWSIFDMLGGGVFVDMVKHYKLSRASDYMNEANYLLQQLNPLLGNMRIPDNYRMQIGGLGTFADFLFDGIFADGYMASKIWSSIEHVRELKQKLYTIKDMLTRY